MRTEVLVESRPAHLRLSAREADALTRIGRRLASDQSWWGGAEDAIERSLIECLPTGGGMWRVTVRDAIGMW